VADLSDIAEDYGIYLYSKRYYGKSRDKEG